MKQWKENHLMKYLLTLFTLLFLFSCSTNKMDTPYSKIEYSAGACFGFCPIYKMTISSDQTAVFEAKRFNFSRDTDSQEDEGTFTGKIGNDKYDELISILNDLKLSKMKDHYGNRNVSDLPTSNLNITYKDGKEKKIEDYGKHGTPELQKLYQFFDALKTNQTWTKIK